MAAETFDSWLRQFQSTGFGRLLSPDIIKQIRAWWDGLDSDQQQKALAQLQAASTGPSQAEKDAAESQQLQSMMPGFQIGQEIRSGGAKPPPTPQGLGMTPAHASGGTSPSPGAAATPSTPTPGLPSQLTEQSPLTDQQYIDLMRVWGLSSKREVDDMMGSYRDSYYVTYQLNQYADYVGAGGIAGQPAAGQPGAVSATPPSSPFAAAQQGEAVAGGQTGTVQSPTWTISMHPLSDVPTGREGRESLAGRQEQRLLTPQDVYAATMYSGGGIAQRVIQQYREKYLNDMGTAMPDDLVQQLQSAVSGLDPSQLQQWLSASIAQPGGSINIPALNDILTTYETEHPTPTQAEAKSAQMIASSFQSALGRYPTQAELAALGKEPSPQQVSDYINTLPMPGYPGMTYGQYQAVSKNMDSLWNQNFGKQPTAQELLWGVGKSGAQLQDFVDNSPSQIPGVTIGRYNDLVSWIGSTAKSGATTHAFSAGVDDSLVKSLHDQLQSASTQQAHPGAMN